MLKWSVSSASGRKSVDSVFSDVSDKSEHNAVTKTDVSLVVSSKVGTDHAADREQAKDSEGHVHVDILAQHSLTTEHHFRPRNYLVSTDSVFSD